MSIVLSLQGCMAAGKTTVARYVDSKMSNLFVSYENPNPVLERVCRQGWDKNTLEGFVEIQRLFIQNEIDRWESVKKHENVLVDLGSDEIEFYTLFYPKSMGFDWDIEILLKDELAALRQYRYTGVLFLDASRETLISNKLSDNTRKRSFFNHYLNNLYALKIEWFKARQQPETEFINIDGMNIEQVGEQVIKWIYKYCVS